jgi:hypothetical protein
MGIFLSIRFDIKAYRQVVGYQLSINACPIKEASFPNRFTL